MEILVKENDTIRGAYSFANFFRYLYVLPVIVAFGYLLTKELIPICIAPLILYIFGILCLRPMRITSFSDEHFTAIWPESKTVRYDSIRAVLNMNPYSDYTYWLFIKYETGFLITRFNFCWIPVDQGIIEHLKSRGVKIRNLWFWREK